MAVLTQDVLPLVGLVDILQEGMAETVAAPWAVKVAMVPEEGPEEYITHFAPDLVHLDLAEIVVK